MKILIIEDEPELVKSMSNVLTQAGFLCEIALTSRDADQKVLVYDYDCILLDINLPDGNGLTILEKLKSNNKSDGIIIITANDSLDDRVKGLNLGADDYLSKPFYLPELIARVGAVIRRKQFGGTNRLCFNEIAVDLNGKSVFIHEREITLTRKEFDLLTFLIANKNRVISKNAIGEHLSGDDADLMDNFDFIYTHIKNLKRKMVEGGSEDYIKTVYGLGYKFSV